jgi:hypothetical protein
MKRRDADETDENRGSRYTWQPGDIVISPPDEPVEEPAKQPQQKLDATSP